MAADEYLGLLSSLRFDGQKEMVDVKVKKVSDVFANMTHLLNLMRPSQARQSLISILQKQIEQRKEERMELEM